jgi:urea transport system substrate-binding protein
MSQTSTDSRCPGAGDWRRLLGRQLSTVEQEVLERHLDGCPACRRLVQGLRAETPAGIAVGGGRADTEPSPVPFDKPTSTRRFDFLAPPLEPGEMGWLGHYRIRGVLGEGGMGVVFDAEETTLQRQVALKVMKPDLAANLGARQRFLQEARAAAALPNDHVVTIYAVGQENDVPFLAMEYLAGESLEDCLDREGRLPLPELLRVGREAALGLAAAHDRCLIHRDIKPANLWLEGARARVKILDFGLARSLAAASNLTASGFIVGTPYYLAPEQARGLPNLDGRCDLFSLGVVLYRAAAGVLPFNGPDPLSVITALATQEPRALAELAPDLPPAVAGLIHRLLAKDPARRPASAGDLVAELTALEQGRAPAAPAVTPSRTIPVAPLGSPPRRSWTRWCLAASLAAFVLVNAVLIAHRLVGARPGSDEPIKVGLLFSLSGLLKDNGSSTNDAALLAIAELNDKGGVLGRRLEPVVADGASDEAEHAAQAERLITQEHVSVIVGCWTSAARKAVKPVVERHDHLLLYPVQYEGLEQSPNIFYLGATPNQEILPALRFATGMLRRRRVFLVGTDTVYTHAVNAVLRDALRDDREVAIVGEQYYPLGVTDYAAVVAAIRDNRADLIVSNLNADPERKFPRTLRAATFRGERPPVLSFDVPESELRGLNARLVVGDYIACNYLESVQTPENEAFVRKFRERYGPQRSLSDPMENAYVGVHLWARAVEAAGSPEPARVRPALEGLTLDAPAGSIKIDPVTHHTWNVVRVARILPEGRLRIVFSTEQALPPEPFPPTRTREQWEQFLDGLYRGWGNRWEAPAR